MFRKMIFIFVVILILSSCNSMPPSANLIGKFNAEKDLFLPQFDCKTDVDDLHSVAGVATLLADPRLAEVRYHAVAGAYGVQEGLYVPANELFEAAFGNKWSDAHNDYNQALKEVTTLVTTTLGNGGNIWIAEAGQSDFSADLVRSIKKTMPEIDTRTRVNIVQHSDWNENSPSPHNLEYVKANVAYHKIPDGNVVGNGSPGFKTNEIVITHDYIANLRLLNIWELAFDTSNMYNGKDNRYNNPAIANGGMDFSDVSESCWIFGFNDIKDAEQFFNEFSPSRDSQ